MSSVFANAVEAAAIEVRTDDRGDCRSIRGCVGFAFTQHAGEFFGGEIDADLARRAGGLADGLGRAAGLTIADAAQEQVADLAEAALGVLRILVHGAPDDTPR